MVKSFPRKPKDRASRTGSVGAKATLADGAVRINAALFQQEWKKFQFAFLGANSFTEIHNGPNARIRGLEADITLKLVSGLQLSGAAAYTDAKTKQNLCAIDDITFTCTGAGNFIAAPKGTRLPVTPRFKANATARYSFSIGAAKAYAQALVAHQSSAASDIRTAISEVGSGNIINPAALTGRMRAFTTADFAIGADWSSFSAELFVQNAFDTRAENSRGSQCGSCFSRTYIYTSTPRTVGLRLGTKF
jgi:iron complex outermembrane recepter protein